MPSPGQLRERVTFRLPTLAEDGYGGVGAPTMDKPALRADTRAQIKPLRATEDVVAGAQSGVSRYDVIVRHRTDVTPRHLVIWHRRDGDRRLNVRAVDYLDRRRLYLRLTCDDGVTV